MIDRSPQQDLQAAVDELTKPARMVREYPRIDSHGRAYTYKESLIGFSLLEELLDAILPGNANTERGTFGSRPTIDAGAFDLWTGMRTDIHEWAKELEIDRANYSGNENVPKLLRSVSATAPGRWDDLQLRSVAGYCWKWSRQIRSMLHDHRMWRGIRGATCENCAATWRITARISGGRKETYREPVILVQVHPETRMIQYFICRECKHMTWPSRGANAA